METNILGALWSGVSLLVWALAEVKLRSDRGFLSELEEKLVRDPISILPANDNAPVYVAGLVTIPSGASVSDPLLGVSLFALRLFRQVEMYQWHEKLRGEYSLSWDSCAVKSQQYPKVYRNPRLGFKSTVFRPEGPLALSPYLIDSDIIDGACTRFLYKPVLPYEETLETLKKKNFILRKDKNYYYLSRKKKRKQKKKSLDVGYVPWLGDYRVMYQYIPTQLMLSVIGQQTGDYIGPYHGLLIVREGRVTPEEMLNDYRKDVTFTWWALRAVLGAFVLAGGYFALRKTENLSPKNANNIISD